MPEQKYENPIKEEEVTTNQDGSKRIRIVVEEQLGLQAFDVREFRKHIDKERNKV